jgi:hypothetical protein
MFEPDQLLEALSSSLFSGISDVEASASLASSEQTEHWNSFAPAASSRHAYTSDVALTNSPEDIASMLEHSDGVTHAQERSMVDQTSTLGA